MTLKPYRQASGVLACLLPLLSAAQNVSPGQSEAKKLDEIIVTATRSAQTLKSTIGDNTVVNREALDQTPNATLAEVLGRQHAITFVNSGGPQTLSTINIRGANSNQSLVLIDGVRVNNGSNGLPALNAMPTNSIERIEIVRGASSSLYGADAIGGVVNIITRKPGEKQPFEAYANMGVGTYSTSEYDAGFSGSHNGLSYSLYGGYGQSAGFNATTDKNFFFNPDTDSYYRSNIGGQVGMAWQEGQTLTLRTYQSQINSGVDNGTPFFNDRGLQTLSNTSITSSNQINKIWLSTLTASILTDQYDTKNLPTGNLNTTQTYKTDQTQYVWQNNFKLSVSQQFSVAYERLTQKVSGQFSDGDFVTPSYVGYQNAEVNTNSFVGVYQGEWGPHAVQLSARNDANSQYGNFATGSIGYAYQFTSQWRGNVGLNTGFRAPNFNELYWPATSSFVGNPNLQPEKSKNIEVGLQYTHNEGQLGVTMYQNEITNLIINEPSQPGSFVFQANNIGKATIKGVTLNGNQFIAKNTQIIGSFDWLSPINDDNNELLPLRAQRVLKLAAEHTWHETQFGLEWYLSSARREVFSKNNMGGYGLLNASLAYNVSKHATIQVRWNNVLGRQYNLVENYNTPGSNVFVNLALKY
jgi:vitamin B12 transporter